MISTKEMKINLANDPELIRLNEYLGATAKTLGTVPAGKVWYVFQIWNSRSEATAVACEVNLYIRNEVGSVIYTLYKSNQYSYGNSNIASGEFIVPFKMYEGWDLRANNSHPGNGLYYSVGVHLWERDA